MHARTACIQRANVSLYMVYVCVCARHLCVCTPYPLKGTYLFNKEFSRKIGTLEEAGCIQNLIILASRLSTTEYIWNCWSLLESECPCDPLSVIRRDP